MPLMGQGGGPWLGELVSVAAQARWRLLLWLSGERAWASAWCQASPALCSPAVRWLGDHPPAGCQALRPEDAMALLGSECAHLVVDAWSGFHPNAFGALAGTVRAGGLLVLLTPPPEDWPQYHDPDYRRMDVAGFAPATRALFLAHLVRTLQSDAGVVHLRQGGALPGLPAFARASPAQQGAALAVPPDCLTVDQAETVQAIERVVFGHRNRPLVVCADRGRGKTAALGIASARLLHAGVDDIVVTAPALANVRPLFERARDLLPGAEAGAGRLRWRESRLRFMAPDALLGELPPARLLLVDEAAAIPTPLLSRMLDHYHRVVFTTTVHGYEGTGRGFALRFQRELSRRRPHWALRTLREPVRWSAADPLEATVGRLLWLQSDPPAPPELSALAAAAPRMEAIERQWLLDEPQLMEQLVGLLTLAHYRTTPDDCRLLMDAPNVRLAVMRCRGSVIGALLLALEGPLPPALAAEVVAGRRRPRGHLLPQAVQAQSGCTGLLGAAGVRVVRIAVHPELQRRGLGAMMLVWLEQWARGQALDYIGASFGASPDLLPFWRQAGFVPVGMGLHRDGSSGEHSLLVLKALAPALGAVVAGERQRFAEVLPWHLAGGLRLLEPVVVARLLAQLPCTDPLSGRDRVDLLGFIAGARSAEHCAPALRKAALCILASPAAGGELPAAEVALLSARLLQLRDWRDVARTTGLRGKAQMVAALRGIVARQWPVLTGDQSTPDEHSA